MTATAVKYIHNQFQESLGGNQSVNPAKQKSHAVPQNAPIITPVNHVKEI